MEGFSLMNEVLPEQPLHISIKGDKCFESVAQEDGSILVRTKWINAKHDLPKIDKGKYGKHVIGYCRTSHNPEWHVEPLLYIEEDGNHLWAYLFAYNQGYNYAEEVSLWTPLPDPPKEL